MEEQIIAYMKKQRDLYSYEGSALSGGEFSRFLDGLLDIIRLYSEEAEND